METFTDLLELYLDLRDELKDEENNFVSIQDRVFARQSLTKLKRELDLMMRDVSKGRYDEEYS